APFRLRRSDGAEGLGDHAKGLRRRLLRDAVEGHRDGLQLRIPHGRSGGDGGRGGPGYSLSPRPRLPRRAPRAGSGGPGGTSPTPTSPRDGDISTRSSSLPKRGRSSPPPFAFSRPRGCSFPRKSTATSRSERWPETDSVSPGAPPGPAPVAGSSHSSSPLPA